MSGVVMAVLAGCGTGGVAGGATEGPTSPDASAEGRPRASRATTIDEGAPHDALDADRDGIADVCDACPRDPGPRWPGYAGIDGCSSAVFHTTVRAPEGATAEELAAHARRKERMQREAVCAR